MNRRHLLTLMLAAPVPLIYALGTRSADAGAAGSTGLDALAAAVPGAAMLLAPTPACADADDVTPAQTEGPYFTPSSPERTSLLEDGMPGTKIVVSGRVVSRSCQPIAGALIDFWQCDDAGQYDNVGYTLRGHQFTDDAGAYRLETVVPGVYPGRTRHVHVKVQAPNQPILTTQLYFPNESGNARDGIFRRELVMAVAETADGKDGQFTFVLNLA